MVKIVNRIHIYMDMKNNYEDSEDTNNQDSTEESDLVEGADASDQSESFIVVETSLSGASVDLNQTLNEVEAETMVRRSSRVPKPKILNDFVSYGAVVSEEHDPIDFEEAMERRDASLWKEAMNEEFKALTENETWCLVEPPTDCKPIKCKWVFKTKEKLQWKSCALQGALGCKRLLSKTWD